MRCLLQNRSISMCTPQVVCNMRVASRFLIEPLSSLNQRKHRETMPVPSMHLNSLMQGLHKQDHSDLGTCRCCMGEVVLLNQVVSRFRNTPKRAWAYCDESISHRDCLTRISEKVCRTLQDMKCLVTYEPSPTALKRSLDFHSRWCKTLRLKKVPPTQALGTAGREKRGVDQNCSITFPHGDPSST